jgi:mannose-6-phosphate isomerase-like protein (cupin superfamily)
MPARSTTRIPKPWGYELLYARSGSYAGKILHIDCGKRLSRQYHQVKEETLYVHTGRMDLEIGSGGEVEHVVLGPGDCYHLPPGTVHRMTAIEDTDVLEVSSPELDDVVRIEDDYGRS